MKYFFFLSMLFFLTSCPIMTLSYGSVGKIYVVSLGLDYENMEIPALRGTIADSSEFAQCLNDIYESKKIDCETYLLVSNSTIKDVNDVLNSINVKKDDLVVFYYSGHGLVKDEKLNLVLCKNEDVNNYDLLSSEYLLQKFKEYECPCVIILDCCYSGFSINQDERSLKDILLSFISKSDYSNISIITSSKADQVSYVSSVFTEEGVGENHSLFSILLLEKLGWVHSEGIVRKLNNISVYGYLNTIPDRLTTYDLFNQIIDDWKSVIQIPVINRTCIPVTLIPY